MYNMDFLKILNSNFRWIQLPLNLDIFSTLVSQKFGVITKMTITSSGYRWGHQLMNKKWIIFNCKVYDVCMCSYFRLKFKWLTIHLAMIQQFLMSIFLQKLMTLLLLVSKLNVPSHLTDLLWKVFQWIFEKYKFSASQKINVTRDATKHLERITNEHGNIVIDVNQTESSDTLYRAG